jgi:hypothetical protein
MNVRKDSLYNILNNSQNVKNNIPPTAVRHKKQEQERVEITYNNYTKTKMELTKYKLPELKTAAKTYKLHVSGKKEVLIERLTTHFKHITYAIKIQSTFRKWLVIQMCRLRGPAFKNIEMCVNDTDFSTLEPLKEIPKSNFYSLTDRQNFTYGFNITSLIELLKQNKNIKNPYNRENLDNSTINNIVTLYKCCFLIIPDFKENNPPYTHTSQTNNLSNRIRNERTRLTNSLAYNPHINPISTQVQLQQFVNIRTLRATSITNRINQLFIKMDQLGNYTNSEWFTHLDMRGYIRLYRNLHDIWFFRSGLSYAVRTSISPFCCPFDGIFNHREMYSDLSLPQLQNACLLVFENLVYSGVNEENQVLGTYYALAALTTVSIRAREAMPWLYEAVM